MTATTTTTTSNPQNLIPDPEALKRYLLSLSFPFVEVTDSDESYGLEPPLNTSETYTIPKKQLVDIVDSEHVYVWPTTPDMSASNSQASSTNSSMPSTPLLTPALPNVALPLSDDHRVKDYFSEHEHHTFSEKILAWGVNHLQALEAFVHPHDEEHATCHPAPKEIHDNAHIEPAHVGAQVRFLIRPMPPKREPSHTFSPLLAAVAGGLFGYGDSEDLLADEEYELAEADFGLE